MLITQGPFEGLRRNGYRAILADVPWKFLARSDKGMDRSPDRRCWCEITGEPLI